MDDEEKAESGNATDKPTAEWLRALMLSPIYSFFVFFVV